MRFCHEKYKLNIFSRIFKTQSLQLFLYQLVQVLNKGDMKTEAFCCFALLGEENFPFPGEGIIYRRNKSLLPNMRFLITTMHTNIIIGDFLLTFSL